MKLSEALYSDVRLICDRCTAHQPAFIQHMITEHGEDAELNEALKTAPCFFCKKKGELRIFGMGT